MSRRAVPSARRDSLLVVVASLLPLVLFMADEWRIAGATGFPLDDSWIHLHFARNLVEGAGFSYNPHVPVAGSTAPLWTLLLAGGALLAGPSVVMAKTLGVFLAMSGALVTRRAALAWGATPVAALGAAVGMAWAGPLVWGALSGMEVSLAALLVAAVMLAVARGRDAVAAVLVALAALARPEAILLVPLLLLSRPLSLGRLALVCAIVTVVLAPAVAFSLATVGAPVPATAVAKVEGGLLGWLHGAREPTMVTLVTRPRDFAWDWVEWLIRTNALLVLAIVPGLVVAWRRGGRPLLVLALALLAHPLGMALLAPYRPPSFQEGRYSMHLLPLALIVLAVAATSLPARVRRSLVVLYLAAALVTLPRAGERYAWGVQNINAMQVHLGRWVSEHLPPGASLALNDIGAITYVSRRPVIDLMGLVTPDILPYRREGEGGVARYIAERCPDYVIVFPAWFPGLTARRDVLAPMYRVELTHNEVAGAAEMVVYSVKRCAV
jgi:arabinofuranosyltransferase